MSWGGGRERGISLQSLQGWALAALGENPWGDSTMPMCSGQSGGQQKLALCPAFIPLSFSPTPHLHLLFHYDIEDSVTH